MKKKAKKTAVSKKKDGSPSPKSLDAIFRPRSVAVVGASTRKHQIGYEILKNLIDHGFTGPVYPVNPNAKVVHSITCFPKVSAIPGPVDLAILSVPSTQVIAAAKDCAKKGVTGMVVVTAGFAELGEEGVALQDQLIEICQKNGIRVVGPNCMGVLNVEEELKMNASFAHVTPAPGGVAFLSQSGALGEAILADASDLGIGFCMFASLGNRADVSAPDLLEYWKDNDNVTQILMYLEALGDPERFMRVARRVTAKKPVLLVKAGRSVRGARAAMSHTGSLAGSEAAVDSLLNQCGILRVESMKKLFSLASAVQNMKFPKGNRVAIVSNAGGPGILATDACEAVGLDLVDLEPKTRREIETFVPKEASTVNPVDLIATADSKSYDKALRAVVADRNIDMVIVIFVSPVMIDSAAVATKIAERASATKKPIVACMLGKMENEAALQILRDAKIPHYRFPEEAAHVLSDLLALGKLQKRSYVRPPRFRVNKAKARAAVQAAIKSGREMLKGTQLYDLFTSYGIPLVPSRIVTNMEDAITTAEELGYPVVAKVETKAVVHKSDTGGVILDIRSNGELATAYTKLKAAFGKLDPHMKILIQSMRRDGVETFFGAAPDPKFGRMLAFGLGGVHVEVFKDVVFRLHPITRSDAEEMIGSIRGKALLEGARGKPPVDKELLIDILLRLSQMLGDIPEIKELDMNPFLATHDPGDSCALDARVRVAPLTTP